MSVTSPDLPVPVDLTLHEVTETQLVDAMLTAMRLNIPEWDPQEGATEIMLMEAAALVMGQFIFALNQAPRVTLDGLVALHGVSRHQAVPANGKITVTVASSTLGTQLLPSGARFRIDMEGGASVDFVSVENVSINPGDGLTAVVNVLAADPGTLANAISVGTPAVMVDQYTWIESAIVSQTTGGGADIESDDSFYARAAATLASYSNTLVTAQQFTAAALANPAVGRAHAYSLWDGVGTAGTMIGHVAVAVAAPDGTDVTSGIKSAVLTTLTDQAVAGLLIHVIDFAHVAMNLTIVYTLDPNYAQAAVSVAIETELRSWLNPATWPLSDTLTSVNQIILHIGRVPGVTNVTSVTGWVPVSGGATLPSISSVTISTT